MTIDIKSITEKKKKKKKEKKKKSTQYRNNNGRCPWCNGFRRRKWAWRQEFKS